MESCTKARFPTCAHAVEFANDVVRRNEAGMRFFSAMAKRRKTGICAYCGNTDVNTEVEHVFPESWYPDGHPRTNMITVPSCMRCNRDYGRAEERLFLPFACALPANEGNASVFERAKRGADASAARDTRDASHRAARLRRFTEKSGVASPTETPNNAAWTTQGRPTGVIRTPSGLVVRGSITMEIDQGALDALSAKFIRGIYYYLRNIPYAGNAKIAGGMFTSDPTELLVGISKLPGCIVRREKPFQFAYMISPDETTIVAMFVLWDCHVVGATASPIEVR
jgi:hypothetical protein